MPYARRSPAFRLISGHAPRVPPLGLRSRSSRRPRTARIPPASSVVSRPLRAGPYACFLSFEESGSRLESRERGHLIQINGPWLTSFWHAEAEKKPRRSHRHRRGKICAAREGCCAYRRDNARRRRCEGAWGDAVLTRTITARVPALRLDPCQIDLDDFRLTRVRRRAAGCFSTGLGRGTQAPSDLR